MKTTSISRKYNRFVGCRVRCKRDISVSNPTYSHIIPIGTEGTITRMGVTPMPNGLHVSATVLWDKVNGYISEVSVDAASTELLWSVPA
jgi:hypothetical protein